MSNPLIRGLLLTLFISIICPQDVLSEDSLDITEQKLLSIVHLVEEGDSLESILVKYGVTLGALLQLNDFSRLLNINPGNKIVIRSPEVITYKTDTDLPIPTFIYVLQEEDSLHIRWQGHNNVYTRLYFSGDKQEWIPYGVSKNEQGIFKVAHKDIDVNPVIFKLVSVDSSDSFIESHPSDKYNIYYDENENEKILIVDGFDRTSGSWKSPSHDFSTIVAQAIFKHGFNFETCSNEAIIQGLVELRNYETVFWMVGDESTADESVTKLEQEYINSYLSNGGNLFISGSEIAYDLDFKGDERDKEFIHYTLHAEYVQDNADTNRAFGLSNSIFQNLIFNIDDGTHGTYPEDYPDVIRSVFDGNDCIEYQNGVGMAAVFYVGYIGRGKSQYEGDILPTDKIGRVVFMSFPFETVYNIEEKQQLMNAVLEFFGLTPPPTPVQEIVEPIDIALTEIDSGEMKADITFKVPKSRKLDPNAFPTFVFLIYNNSFIEYSLDFNVLLPKGWEILSLKQPLSILPQEKEKVRISCAVPRYALADTTYKLGLITQWGFHTDTLFVGMDINAKPNIYMETYNEEKQVIAGRTETQSFVVQNRGNVTDTLLVEAEMPPNWEIIELIDSLKLSPHERAIIELLFAVPTTEIQETEKKITLKTTSLASKKTGKPITVKNSMKIHVLQPHKKDKEETLFGKIPLNMGFAMNRIEKEVYPEIAFFMSTDMIELGENQIKFELVEKSHAVAIEETPTMSTEQVKFSVMGKNWRGSLGDISLETNPLLTSTSSITLADFQPHDETGRGIFGSYSFTKISVSGFYGKRIYTDVSLAQLQGDYSLSDSSIASATYLNRDKNHNLALEWSTILGEDKSWAALAGISREDVKNATDGAIQVRGQSTIKSIPILGRLFWAGDSYSGSEKGKAGLAVSSRWVPSPVYYLWGNINTFKKSFSEAVSDSSAYVLNLTTRSIIRYQQWPSINLGLNLRQDWSSSGESIQNHNIDLRLEKHIQYGLPTLALALSNKYNQSIDEQQKELNLTLGWISYFTNNRIKFEQKLQKVNNSEWGAVTSLFTGFLVRGYVLELFLNKGNLWQYLGDDEYNKHQIVNYGLRSTFAFQPFGNNYNVNLELGKVASDLDEFTSDWRLSLSFSAKSVPRFYIPVPTILSSTGRVNGEVFIDQNGNGVRDVNERGISDVLMFLRDDNVMTDSDGRFEFKPKESGEYEFVIDEATLPAYLGMSKAVPTSVAIRKGALITMQIPLVSIGSILGVLYYDGNHNGLRDQNERGLKVVRIIIQNTDGQEWEAFTDKDGKYKITDLVPATYTVMIDQRWLPKRFLPARISEEITLTQDLAQQKLNLAVVKEKLKIKKTFTAPKKN